jgi:hypothetical protein
LPCCFVPISLHPAQVGIGTTLANSSILDLTAKRQRISYSSEWQQLKDCKLHCSVDGLIVYDTTLKVFFQL